MSLRTPTWLWLCLVLGCSVRPPRQAALAPDPPTHDEGPIVDFDHPPQCVERVPSFDALPFAECVPPEFLLGTRRVLPVDDGYLIAYAGAFHGVVEWTDKEGTSRRTVSRARVVALTKSTSGAPLGLAIGPARLGRGGVLAFDEGTEPGDYVPRLVATLPVEPSPVGLGDEGMLFAFAEGFLVRIDERGKIENLHYTAHWLGPVTKMRRAPDGTIELEAFCGRLRLAPRFGHYEEDWSSAGREGC